MALNPFEQLRLLVGEPRTAFEDTVGLLLQDYGRIDGRVKVHVGDGGIDAYKGTFGETGELVVYQTKYFPDPWGDSQKQQIRDSFRTANENPLFKLKEWYLCIPTRPTKEDMRWFDTWKSKQPVQSIDLIDGDDLSKMLEEPLGARARNRLKEWGLFTLRAGYASLEFSVLCIAEHPRSHLTFRLVIMLANRGDRTAESLKARIEHSDTKCVPVASDPSLWQDRGNGALNPRTLWATAELNPGDTVQVLQLPLVAQTPFPFWIKASASLRDMSPTEQSVVLPADWFLNGASRSFSPGGIDASAPADGGFHSEPLRANFSEEADNLFMEIVQNPDPKYFGVICYWNRDPANPTKALYRPSLSPTGQNWSKEKRSLDLALNELVEIGWLYPPERVGDKDIYRISDRALVNEIFIYNVNEMAKRREFT